MVWAPSTRPWEEHDSAGQRALYCIWSTEWLVAGSTLAEYKLDPLQLDNYYKMKGFFAKCGNSFDRIWVNERSRRLGKDFESVLFVREEMRKNKEHIYHYGTAYEKDINLILVPLIRIIEQDCPPEWRLVSRESKGMFYDPQTKSELRLIGLDINPNGIRGNRGDGIVITEAAYCSKLEESETAFSPMLVENPLAWRIYNSTPSKSVAHKWCRIIVPRAIKSGGYSKHVLDECPRFTEAQINAAYEEFGGRDTTKSRREYKCEHIGETEAMVIPEWPNAKEECCVKSYPRPLAAQCYVGLDPGMVDLSGLVALYYDFANDMVVVERAVGKHRLNTEQLANEIKAIESPWKDYFWYDSNGELKRNPYLRVCDRELRLVDDLVSKYGVFFLVTAKNDLHAAVNSLRDRIARRKIRILPEASGLVDDLDGAVWNEKRTQLEHVAYELGHFDRLMALVYAHRNLNLIDNPLPKKLAATEDMHVITPFMPKPQWKVVRDRHGRIVG